MYMAAYFSQNMASLSSDVLVNTSVFSNDLKLESGGKTIAARLVCGIVRNRTRDHENSISVGPRS